MLCVLQRRPTGARGWWTDRSGVPWPRSGKGEGDAAGLDRGLREAHQDVLTEWQVVAVDPAPDSRLLDHHLAAVILLCDVHDDAWEHLTLPSGHHRSFDRGDACGLVGTGPPSGVCHDIRQPG